MALADITFIHSVQKDQGGKQAIWKHSEYIRVYLLYKNFLHISTAVVNTHKV